MEQEFKRGQIVEVVAYGGELLVRRVVADLGGRVVICAESEWKTAQSGNREPEGVGFQRKDVRASSRGLSKA